MITNSVQNQKSIEKNKTGAEQTLTSKKLVVGSGVMERESLRAYHDFTNLS